MSLASSMRLAGPLVCLVLLGAPSALAAPHPAGLAQATGDDETQVEARARYNRGVEFYREGDYKLALIEFQRSYELAPSWRILYNVGEVQFQLNNYAAALKTLEKYLSDGGKEVPALRRAEVEKDIEALRARTAFVTVIVNVPDADVTIDDTPIGKSPVTGSVLTDAGNHRISATKSGFRATTKQITLAGRERHSVKLELVEEPRVASPTPQAEKSTNYVWVGWVTTILLAGAATTTGVLAIKAKDDLDELKNKRDLQRSEIDDQESKRDTLAMTTNVLVGATVVAAGISLYFTLAGTGSRSGKSAARATPASSTRVGIAPTGVSLVGSF